MADELPADVKQFINQHVESLAQLEILLLLYSQPDRRIHSGEIAKRLAITPEMSSAILQDLTYRGFATKTESFYQFRSNGPEMDKLVQQVGETYQVRRVAVTSAIYSKPLDRVKTFANAFRLRKEP